DRPAATGPGRPRRHARPRRPQGPGAAPARIFARLYPPERPDGPTVLAGAPALHRGGPGPAVRPDPGPARGTAVPAPPPHRPPPPAAVSPGGFQKYLSVVREAKGPPRRRGRGALFGPPGVQPVTAAATLSLPAGHGSLTDNRQLLTTTAYVFRRRDAGTGPA